MMFGRIRRGAAIGSAGAVTAAQGSNRGAAAWADGFEDAEGLS